MKNTDKNKIKKVMKKLKHRLIRFKQLRANCENLTWGDEMIEDNVKAQIKILENYRQRNQWGYK